MRRYNVFTWIILFFIFIGFLSSLRTITFRAILPIIIIGLVIYFIAHPEKLNFGRRPRNNTRNNGNYYRGNHYSNNNSTNNNRRNNFTVVNGNFKEVKDDKNK